MKVGVLGNNLSNTLTIEGIFVSDISGTTNDDVLTIGSPFNFSTISPGGNTDVTVKCAEGTQLGQRTVTVKVSQGTAGSVSISDVTFTFGADIQCNKGGGTSPVGFSATDAFQNNTQEFTFNVDPLKNRDNAVIDLSDAQGNGIDYTGANVRIVSGAGKGSVSFNDATSEITFTGQGNPKGTVTVEISGFTINGDSGDQFTATYSDDAGRTDGDGYQIE